MNAFLDMRLIRAYVSAKKRSDIGVIEIITVHACNKAVVFKSIHFEER